MSAIPSKPVHFPWLDVLRAIAITLAAFHHFQVTDTRWLLRIQANGWMGVDLFFVLSGYLVSAQIYRSLKETGHFSIRRFYFKRLVRTLPPYYLVLFGYVVLGAFTTVLAPKPLWKFLVFLQNTPFPNTFIPSWSLCVEEHFYLLFPLLCLLLLKQKRVWLLPFLLVGIEVGILAWRTGTVWEYGLTSTSWSNRQWHFLFYSTPARCDGIIVGSLIAWLHVFKPEFFRKIARPLPCLVAGLLLWGFSFYAFTPLYRTAFNTSVGVALIAFAFGCLLLAGLAAPDRFAQRLPGAKWLASRSYVIYLTHIKVLVVGRAISGLFDLTTPFATGMIQVISILVVGEIFYRVVETPVMRWRSQRLAGWRNQEQDSRLREAA